MIVGIIQPDEGDVTVGDTSLVGLPIYKRHQFGIGYLPQEQSVFTKMTVWENLMSLLETRKDLTPEERTAKAESLLDEFNIGRVRDTKGGALSGGERRRDEPFAGVDPLAVEDIQSVVLHLKTKGIGILITDHNVRETLRIVDNAYILSEGRILLHGTDAEIAVDPVAKKTNTY